jgi:Flp pilus assembly protein TadD
MGSVIVILVIVVCAGGIVWWRRRRRHASTAAVSPEDMPRENVALKAFAHGNTCLAEGKFAEATAAFHQARELEPTHPHVAGRLAEVDRRQQAASATAPAT